MSVTHLLGDVMDRLRDLPDDHFDCVVTSPPYWALRDYGLRFGTLSGDIADFPAPRRAMRRRTHLTRLKCRAAHHGPIRSPNGRSLITLIGLEPTLGDHLDVILRVFAEIHRVLKPHGTCWVNYGDCYASAPNGRSAAATKALSDDDRTFRDKPMSTVGPLDPVYATGRPFPDGVPRRGGGPGAFAGPLYDPDGGSKGGGWRGDNKGNAAGVPTGRVVSGGTLKPKDLCMIPNRVAIALQEWGWFVRSEIVWGKPNAMPGSQTDRPTSAHEKIWMLSKSPRYYYNGDAVRMPSVTKGVQITPQGWDTGPGGHGSFHRKGRQKGESAKGKRDRQRGLDPRHADYPHTMLDDAPRGEGRNLRNYEPPPMQVWEIATRPFTEAHFATFPPELVERALLAGCPPGGRVLDPFGGAGTTGLVADQMQLDATLIELNPDYRDISIRRIERDQGPLLAGPIQEVMI